MKRSGILTFIAAAMLAASLAAPLPGGEKVYNSGVESVKLLVSTKDAAGNDIRYPDVKAPELTCLKVTIHPGKETGWHSHTVPGYAYVISGELSLQYAGAPDRVFEQGEAFAEAVKTPHNGTNSGPSDVILAVFFTGEKDHPFTVKENAPAKVR
jgi:quercetin dioxygenase-like cupin family protein